jgi:hypothetical protein
VNFMAEMRIPYVHEGRKDATSECPTGSVR